MIFKDVFKKLKRRTPSPRPDKGRSDELQDPPGKSDNSQAPQVPEDADVGNNGLHLVKKPDLSISDTNPSYPVDVVLVHGLNGHWDRTWTHANGTFWPKDLLPEALPGARIFSYGYPSQIFANKSVAGLRDFATHLLDELRIASAQPSRPIIYVCHSLGGIVVKQALILAYQRNEFRSIWLQSKAIMFMGTPHRGSAYASYGKILGDIVNVTMHVSLTHRFTGGVKTALIESLVRNNEELQAISEDFYPLIQQSSIHITSFYETEANPLTNKTIVEKSSAHLGSGQFIPLYLNHQELCRFSGSEDTNYIKVSEAIKSEAFKPPTEITVASSLCTDYSYDETEKACVALLNTIDIADYESKFDPRVEGTLEWIFHKPQYSDWISNSSSRLLWVTGYVGCGKTILASFIARYLGDVHSKTVICKFFCDGKTEDHRDPRALLRSLIFQLVNQRRKLWRLVKKASDAGGFHIFNQFDALWNLFVQIVRSENKYSVIIVIDALDELDPFAQSRLVARLFEVMSLGEKTSLKVFITSRPNAWVVVDSVTHSPDLVQLSLEDSKDEIDSDIRSVVRHRLQQMEKRGACKPAVREALEKLLVARADQTFLWIKLVLPLLEERRLLLLPDVETLVAHLPISLQSLYEHFLTSIPEGDRSIAAKVLRLLVTCNRPMTGEEIGIILTISSAHRSASVLGAEDLLLGQESIVALLGPLVRVHNSRIELLHHSLKEYLIDLSAQKLDSPVASFGVDTAQESILVVKACTMYLSLADFDQDMYAVQRSIQNEMMYEEEVRSSRSSASMILDPDLFAEPVMEKDDFTDDSIWAAINAKYPLFDYAALHWAAHFTRCGESIADEDCGVVALALCETKSTRLKNWFRYHWLRKEDPEPFPTVVDDLMIASYFGLTQSLLRALSKAGYSDQPSLMRALFWSSRQGNSACVKILLQHSEHHPDASRADSQSPLLAAALFGHLDCLKILLGDSRIDINQQDATGRTALFLAVSNNHQKIVTELLARDGIDVNRQNQTGNTPLHMAVDAASDSIVAELLKDKRADLNRLDRRGRGILSWAAELGATESALRIIETKRFATQEKDEAGRSPLSYAAQHGHLSVVKLLIEKGGASPPGVDGHGRNAHSWAARQRSADVLRYLIQKYPQGADLPDISGWTPLAWTLDPPGYLDNMTLLLRSGRVEVNRKDDVHQRTYLSWTASYGNASMASELIRTAGIDLEAQDFSGRTPLSEAAGSGSLDIVELLVATGKVDINQLDYSNQTPLSWAARGGHLEVVHYLLSLPDVAVEVRNTSGETALDIAEMFDRTEIAHVLRNHIREPASNVAR